MPDQRNVQRILEYVRHYRDRYDLEVLRQQMVAAGYDPADIASAFAQLVPTTRSVVVPPPGRPTTPDFAVATPVQPATSDQATTTADTEGVTPPSAAVPEAVVSPTAALATETPVPDHEAELGRMVAYLQQYKAQYDLGVLRQHLLNAAQDPALVAEALRRVKAGEAATSVIPQGAAVLPTSETRPAAWPFGCLITLVNLVLLPSIFFALMVVLARFGRFLGSPNYGPMAVSVPILILLGEFVGGFLFLRQNNRVGRAFIYGVVYTVGVGLLLGGGLFLAVTTLFRGD